jgi:hypothetical protein
MGLFELSFEQVIIACVICILVYLFVWKFSTFVSGKLSKFNPYGLNKDDEGREKYEIYTFMLIMMISTTVMLISYFSKSPPVKYGATAGSIFLFLFANHMRWNKHTEGMKLLITGSILTSIVIFSTIHIK